MSLPRVQSYQLFWNETTGGEVWLHLGIGPTAQVVKLPGLAFGPYTMLVDLLRNERPIFWDPAAATVSTGIEPVGEEEID